MIPGCSPAVVPEIELSRSIPPPVFREASRGVPPAFPVFELSLNNGLSPLYPQGSPGSPPRNKAREIDLTGLGLDKAAVILLSRVNALRCHPGQGLRFFFQAPVQDRQGGLGIQLPQQPGGVKHVVSVQTKLRLIRQQQLRGILLLPQGLPESVPASGAEQERAPVPMTVRTPARFFPCCTARTPAEDTASTRPAWRRKLNRTAPSVKARSRVFSASVSARA